MLDRAWSSSDQFDRVAAQPHPTLRLQHEQKHADLLTRHLDAESGLPHKRVGNDLQGKRSVQLAVLRRVCAIDALRKRERDGAIDLPTKHGRKNAQDRQPGGCFAWAQS
jgi:hypothetical protein